MEWREIGDEPSEVSLICYHPMMGRFLAYKCCIDEKYNAYVWRTWDGESGIMPPTHWMPLPDPPKQNGE